MKRSYSAQWLTIFTAASLLGVPGLATAQQQTTPPTTSGPSTTGTATSGPSSSTSTPASQTGTTTPTTQPTTPTSSQATNQNSQAQSDDAVIPQKQAVNVKPGSDADVNAIGNRNVGKGLDFYSIQKEIALGKQLSMEVEKSAKFITDPVITEYVNRVAQNIVRNSDAQVPFTVKVIDSDVVNAFALPGGFFYVNSGLILHANSEAELAGVMAHEIAHVCARHGTKQATKSDIMQLASIPAMIFIPYTWAGYALYQGMNFAIPLTFLKFSRDDEKQADYLGLQYMYKAGYDPNAFVTFFEKVEADEKKEPGTVAKVFSTHPPTPDRVEATQKEIATILPARDEYIVTTSEFDAVKARLQQIEVGQKVKAGPNRPTLRKRTEQNKGGSTDPNAGSGTDNGSDDSDRPTLKRRPDSDPTSDTGSSPQSFF